MEEPILKNFLSLLTLLSTLWLTGCATQTAVQNDASRSDVGVIAATHRWGDTPVSASKPIYPSANLTPLASAQVGALGVQAVEPPKDLWERLRHGFAMPDLQNDLVLDREKWYSSRPEYMQRMTDRGRKYLFYIVEELERRNMPSELALLPFIESAFNPQAVSSAKAAGMWQFMPATGKHFELTQNMFRDDRRDVLASTRAALDYLEKLHNMFGDWHLALAAYNWGEGSVARAIAKNQKAGLGTTYADLKMPMETRFYVPKLQAVKNIIAAPTLFGATLPEIGNHPYFQTVDLHHDIDVAVAAELAGISLVDFRALNPSASKPVLLAAGVAQILLPWDNAAIFQSNLEAYTGGRLASWTVWTAPTRLTPADVAKRVGMSEDELRAVNKIPARMLINAGSTLVVRRSGGINHDVTAHIAANGYLTLAPAVTLHKTTVKARSKETVQALAQRYRVNVDEVAAWNKVSTTATFKSGQRVLVYLPEKASGKSSANRKVAQKAANKTTAMTRKTAAKKVKATRLARN